MKPESQQAAMEAACGWVKHDMGHYTGTDGIRICNDFGGDAVPPDYLKSLDAMAKAENGLTDEQRYAFASILADLLKLDGVGIWDYDQVFVVAHATAAQRAEAFLRTIGKWVEE